MTSVIGVITEALCVNARVFDLGYVAFCFQELLRADTFQDITSYYKETLINSAAIWRRLSRHLLRSYFLT